MTPAKKLIEVALPLDAINKASAREKSIRHGHPSTLHLWWARRPLAAARAVIFAQMVDDPSAYESDAAKAERERQRLFAILEDLVLWENTTNEAVLQRARDAIRESWRRTCAANSDHPRAAELFDPERLPAFHDPFAGGGALPLEAQRLGLESYASDLNPVAVLINKAMIEIPPRFAGRPPVNPKARQDKDLVERQWTGAQGLAEDVRYYGQWMRDEAEKRIGQLYPKVSVTAEMAQERPDLKPYAGRELTVIAWLWARTVKSPNPAFADVDVPLASTFMLSTKKGKEAYVEPVIENGGYRFPVKLGVPEDAEAVKAGTSAGKRQAFQCLMSGVPISYDYIRTEGQADRMGVKLMAIVAEGNGGRIYLEPLTEHEVTAFQGKSEWQPDVDLPKNPRDFKTPGYGLRTFADLFTPRQLVALTTFSDLVSEAQKRVNRDYLGARASCPHRGQKEGETPSLPGPTAKAADEQPLRDGGTGATAYAEAVGLYLGMSSSRAADAWSTITSWRNAVEATRGTFARQALPMVWDYAEANPLSSSSGNWTGACVNWVAEALDFLPQERPGAAVQLDATRQTLASDALVSTDPPYYDNIGYADLSDFFYVWLRRTLRLVLPELFVTLAVPKAEELVATPYRHGTKEKAEAFFLAGMTQAVQRLAEQTHPGFPVTIYYAFKQSEAKGDAGTVSTGWETFLDAVIEAGFAITGTWPIRTERGARSIGIGSNALASSIVLVCRRRPTNAPLATRREFVTALKTELPAALTYLQRGNIAPVDLAQAAIGPGMAIYTRHAKVLDTQGQPLPVREALALINQTLDEALAEQEGDFDADTRWALAWFDQAGFDEGDYGVAETLSKAKNTSVDGLVQAGILVSRGGKVRLLRPRELSEDWNPATDPRLTAWETVHHLVHTLESGGESAAAELAAALGSTAETARELCYRLYALCESRKRAAEALSYNALVQSWPEITRLAQERRSEAKQATLFAGTGS